MQLIRSILFFIKAIADLGTFLTKQPCKQEVQYIMVADFRNCLHLQFDKTSRITEGMEGTTPNVWPTATVSISNDCPGMSSLHWFYVQSGLDILLHMQILVGLDNTRERSL